MLNKTLVNNNTNLTIRSGNGCITGNLSVYEFKMTIDGAISIAPSVNDSTSNRLKCTIVNELKKNNLTLHDMCNVTINGNEKTNKNKNIDIDLSNRVEELEMDNILKDKKIKELEDRLSKLESLLLGNTHHSLNNNTQVTKDNKNETKSSKKIDWKSKIKK